MSVVNRTSARAARPQGRTPKRTAAALTARPAVALSRPVAASHPVPVPPAGVSRVVFAALETWPAALDRARMSAQWLFPLGFGEQTARVRALLEPVQAWAKAHPEAASIPLSPALCEALREWPGYMERARASGGPLFSLNELLALETALPAMRDVLAAQTVHEREEGAA